MTGLRLFVAAVRLFLQNPDAAMRIALFPVLFITAASTWAWANGSGLHSLDNPDFDFLYLLPELAIFYLVWTWIAVAWHRFVLLSEKPKSYLPEWRGLLITGYLARWFAIFFLAAVVYIPIEIAVHGVDGLNDEVDGLSDMLLTVGLNLLIFIGATRLPAYAIQASTTGLLKSAVRNLGTIVVISFLFSALVWPLEGLFELLKSDDIFAFVLLSLAYNLTTGLLWISLLTVLYEHLTRDHVAGSEGS